MLLRKTLSRYVEKEVAEREKQGFSSPDSSWFKGDSKNYIKNQILDTSNPIYNVFSFNTIESLVNEHITGKRNRRLLIWSLLHLSYYFKQNTISSNQL
jgi:asparagine synthase (glutamine-hydrolysing)